MPMPSASRSSGSGRLRSATIHQRPDAPRCSTSTRPGEAAGSRPCHSRYTRAVQSLDLTTAQAEPLLAIVERQRVFLEKVYARCVELEYPAGDLFRQRVSRAVVAQRELCL